MTRIIAKFRKAPGDRKRYEINYADWLNEGEVITEVNMIGDMPIDGFFIDGYNIDADGKEVIFYVSGGMPGVSYNVNVAASTSLSQLKTDVITFVVT